MYSILKENAGGEAPLVKGRLTHWVMKRELRFPITSIFTQATSKPHQQLAALYRSL